MKKLVMIEKCKLIATVLKSDLTPEEKAEKLSILKDDDELETFSKLTFRELYIALLDHLGIEEYKGDNVRIKHIARVF
ncbi:hypothetical protein [uncultured Granulicatella sp.]|uniref:hypothetical protein n=1 Tax=uncultured Granulicatella sp. TaxID=316089 RepID=UPI0028D1B724|nr:hypothetical protein [uncultured Granulicatella sp.]